MGGLRILPSEIFAQWMDREKSMINKFKQEHINCLGVKFPTPEYRWEYVHADDDLTKFVIVPSHPSPFVYRGQNRIHHPCFPSAWRFLASAPILTALEFPVKLSDLPAFDRLNFILTNIRFDIFADTLQVHPAAKFAKTQRIRLEEFELAQHYGLRTNHIDLTELPDVAAFFATCAWNPDENAWKPMQNGLGILYRLAPTRENYSILHSIGLQPFPRPAEQYGWTLDLPLGLPFEEVNGVHYIVFEHNSAIGEKYLEQFQGGADLFPDDPLANAANRINTAEKLPRSAAIGTIETLMESQWGLGSTQSVDELLEQISLLEKVDFIEARPDYLTPLEIQAMNARWEGADQEFMKGITFRLVRSLKHERLEKDFQQCEKDDEE